MILKDEIIVDELEDAKIRTLQIFVQLRTFSIFKKVAEKLEQILSKKTNNMNRRKSTFKILVPEKLKIDDFQELISEHRLSVITQPIFDMQIILDT